MDGNELKLLENMRATPQEVNFSGSSPKEKLCSNQDGQNVYKFRSLGVLSSSAVASAITGQNLLNDNKINVD